MGRTLLKLILFVLPLGLDTFAVSAALGLQGLPKRERLRVSLLMSGFEMGMPLVGLLVGRSLGTAIGAPAEYVAASALILLGAYMLREDEQAEREALAALSTRATPALIGLGLSISLDELAIGFTIGLLHVPLAFAVILIGAQAFVLAQLGLRLGAQLGEKTGQWSERLAALALIGLGVLVVVEHLASA